MVTKLKLDPKAAMADHHKASTASAQDRFAMAAQITAAQPTGLSAQASQAPESAVVGGAGGSAFSISQCVVGRIVAVPLSLIDPNPLSPRHFYRAEDVDRIAETLPDGQDVAAHGYVKGQRIQLIDGGTRLRAARITDRGVLEVKIEEAPSGDIELFERARAINEQRTATTALDFALSLRNLLDRGSVTSQDEIVEKIKGPEGELLTKSKVSMYLRVARMPERLLRAMSEHPETSTISTLYAISEIFEAHSDADEQGRAADLEAALGIAEDARRRKLNRAQITSLVKTYLEGPKARERSALTPIELGENKGQIKVFRKKGQIDLSLRGLSEDELPEVKQVLVSALEEFARKRASKTAD